MSSRLITANELLQAPTGVDWNSIGEGGISGAQFLEEGNLIDSASFWVANEIGQPLGLHATTQNEQAVLRRASTHGAKVWATREGSLQFRTDTLPICTLTQLQLGYLPNPVYVPLDPTQVLIVGSYPQVFRFEDWSRDWTGYQFGTGVFGLSQLTKPVIQATYVSGWPNALLLPRSPRSSVGATSYAPLTAVDAGAAWIANQWYGMTVYAGASTGVVASNTATVITLTSAGWTGGTPSNGTAFTIAGPTAATSIQTDYQPGSNVTLTVDSTLGMATAPYFTGQDNSTLALWDQAKEETVSVSSIIDSTHVVVASMSYDHLAGVRLSNLPHDIRQATIYFCIHLARERGTDSLVIGGTSTRTPIDERGDAEDQARILLSPYQRRI